MVPVPLSSNDVFASASQVVGGQARLRIRHRQQAHPPRNVYVREDQLVPPLDG